MIYTNSSKGNMFCGIQCRMCEDKTLKPRRGFMKFIDLIIDNQSNGALSGLPQK